MENDLRPARCTVNKYVQQIENNTISWLPWEACPTFDQEREVRESAAAKNKWLPDASGVVRERVFRAEPEADLSTHHTINLALTRRGMGAHLAGYCSFEAHEKLRSSLVRPFTERPSDPNYEAPSLHRIRDADKCAWRLLAKVCPGGPKPAPGASALPIDDAMDKVLASAEFTN